MPEGLNALKGLSTSIINPLLGEKTTYRLVTRSDFDGLVCAIVLKHLGLIDDILFVHPKDMQDGKIAITDRDITTNLPYVDGVYLAFDHHLSETLRVGQHDNHIIDATAPSAARVVFRYFEQQGVTFPERWYEMMLAVDKADAAQFTREEILYPKNWVLLNYLMDARTGLGRFRNFRVSNYNLMMNLIDYCKDHTIEEILAIPDVHERVEMYFEQEPLFRDQLMRCSQIHGPLIMLDLTHEDTIHAGNRFVTYALNPDCNISIHRLWGLKQQNTVFAVGKSIVNRSSGLNVGELMLSYNGGGHANAGTCQVENDQADRVQQELIDRIVNHS